MDIKFESVEAFTYRTALKIGVFIVPGIVLMRLAGPRRRAQWTIVAAGIVAGLALACLNLASETNLGRPFWPWLSLYATYAVVVAPVTEEILFRGGILRCLEAAWPKLAANAITAALFSISHFPRWSLEGRFDGAPHVWAEPAALAFLCGLVLGWIVQSTGSVATGILAHSAFNLTA